MKTLKYILPLFAFIVFISCTTQNGTSDNQTLNLELSGTWILTGIAESSGTNLKDGFPNKIPSLTLEAITKKLTGHTGCNQMFGSFTTQNNEINFSGIGSTRMHCENVKESSYLAMFEQIKTYKISENQLEFFDASGNSLLTYTPK